MNKNHSFSDRQIDQLLAGKQVPGQREDRQIAAFFGSARRVLSLPPDQATEAAHLAAIVKAARSAAVTAPAAQVGRAAKPRTLGLRLRTAAAKVSIAALGLTTTTAGLAMAGVNLPGTFAEKVFGAVGIDLPNQDSGAKNANAGETSKRVHDAIDKAREGSMSGCEFGAAVSQAARGDTDEADTAHCDSPGRNKSGNESPGSKERGQGHQKQTGHGVTPPGHGGDNPGQGNDNPGHGGDTPGQGNDNPGHGGDNPGQGDDNPGHGGDNPGQGDDNRGQDDDSEDDEGDDSDEGSDEADEDDDSDEGSDEADEDDDSDEDDEPKGKGKGGTPPDQG